MDSGRPRRPPGQPLRVDGWTWKAAAWLLLPCLLLLGLDRLCSLYLRYQAGVGSALYAWSPKLGHFHVPNTRIRFHFKAARGEGESTHDLVTNAKGLRDKERSYEKGKNTFRILVLGDSIVFAEQVPQELRFTDLLESKLNQPGEERRYEVINAGVDGYGTDQELLYLEQEGFKYKPDLVIVCFSMMNDLKDNSREFQRKAAPYALERPYFALEGGALVLRNFPARSSFLTRSALYRAFSSLAGREAPGLVRLMNRHGLLTSFPLTGEYVRNGIPSLFEQYSDHYSSEWLDAFALTKAIVERLHQQAALHGARVLVLIMPDKFQLENPTYWAWMDEHFPAVRSVHWQWDRPTEQVRRDLSEIPVEYLDLLPLFRAYEASHRENLFFKVDFHLNQRGHRFVSEALQEYLTKNVDLLR